VDQAEVLGNDWRGRSRKIERERIFDGAEIVKLKNKVLGKMCFVSPNNPANANIGKAKFVPAMGM
jgi:hypothetical protein